MQEDIGQLLKAWLAADSRAVAAERKVTASRAAGEQPSKELEREAAALRREATAAQERISRAV